MILHFTLYHISTQLKPEKVNVDLSNREFKSNSDVRVQEKFVKVVWSDRNYFESETIKVCEEKIYPHFSEQNNFSPAYALDSLSSF